MTPDERSLLQALGTSALINLGGVVSITVAYGFIGLLTAVILFSTVSNGNGAVSFRSNKRWLQGATIVAFFVATADWFLELIFLTNIIRGGLVDNVGMPLAMKRVTVNQHNLPVNRAIEWLSVLLPITNDMVTIWRAKAIFPTQRRWHLSSMFMCFATLVIGFSKLGIVSHMNDADYSRFTKYLDPTLNSLNAIFVSSSLATNTIATSSVAYGLWLYRSSLHFLPKKERQQFSVLSALALLVESGFVYGCLQAIVTVIAWIPYPSKVDLSTLYFAGWQIYTMASIIYTPLVIFLVRCHLEAALEESWE